MARPAMILNTPTACIGWRCYTALMAKAPPRHKPYAAQDGAQRENWARYEQRHPERRHRLYGATWRAARAAYLAQHPLCAECAKDGRTTIAVDLDHIQPHRGDRGLFWDSSNWQGLCRPCHTRKTRRGE